MKGRLLTASVLLAASSALPSPARDMGWVQVRTPHLEVISNGTAKDARQVAVGFEQMRTIFAQGLSNMRVDSVSQTIVLAPRDERTMRELLPNYSRHNGQSLPAGLFRRGWERDYAIVRLGLGGYQQTTVYHEYIHKLLHLNFPRLPTWLDEGVAEFFGNAQVRKGKAILGMPSPRLQTLRERAPYPLNKLLTAGPGSPYLTHDDQVQMFYAESWGLTHYLMFGKGMGNGERFNQYLGLLQHGADPVPAFRQVFGDLKQVEMEFERYINQAAFMGFVWNHTIDVGEQDFKLRELSPAETDAKLGGFYLYFGQQDTAERLLKRALTEQPKLAAAHENMAFLHFIHGNDQEAEQEFDRVLQIDPSNFLALYYRAMLADYKPSAPFAHVEALDVALRQVLRLNPNFSPALVVQSRLYVQEHRNAEALQAALRAQHLEPDRAGYALNVAQIVLLLRDKAQAAAIAAYVARRWWGPDRAEALDLLARTETPTSKPADVPALDYTKGTQAASGTVESVTCAKPGDTPHDMQLILRTPGGPLAFHAKAFAAGFSDTIWYGEDHFTICHHLTGLRAVVRYKIGSDSQLPGELVWLEIRDDLDEPGPVPNHANALSAK